MQRKSGFVPLLSEEGKKVGDRNGSIGNVLKSLHRLNFYQCVKKKSNLKKTPK